MVDGFYCLRHYGVVGCDDYDCKVGHLSTSCTHGCEGLVSRSVKEGDSLPVRKLHVVRSDVLGDTARLTGDHIGLADIVKEGSLTVVNVSHDRNHRRP